MNSDIGDSDDFQPIKSRQPAAAVAAVDSIACPVCRESLAGFDEGALQSHVNRCLDGPMADVPKSVPLSGGQKRKPSSNTPKPTTQRPATNKLGSKKLKPAAASKASFQPSIPFSKVLSQPAMDVSICNPQKAPLTRVDTQNDTPAVLEETIIPPSRDNSSLSIISDESKASATGVRESNNGSNSNVGATASKKPNRICPWYKKLPNTTFTIDAFSYGAIEGCTGYFLSHFHADHYGGLTSKFNFGTIYCSQVTANLVQSQLRVDAQFISVLPMETTVQVEGVNVTLIDANHCPGAVLFLFQTRDSHMHLHTGDFRALHPLHTQHKQLQNVRLKSVYLDTTYLDARYAFPSQSIVLGVLAELLVDVVLKGRKLEEMVDPHSTERNMMRQFLSMGSSGVDNALTMFGGGGGRFKKGTLICVGTYTIGKERVFKSVAKALNSKIFVESSKLKILKCLEDKELNETLTSDPSDAIVHVVKIGQLNKEELEKKLDSVSSHFSRVIAIRPTGWTHQPSSSSKTQSDDNMFTIKSIKPNRLAHNIHVIPIPYSEHSSYTELKTFVQALNVEQIIPTVSVHKHEEMKAIFAEWQMEKKANLLV